MPKPVALVVTNASNILDAFSGGIPIPQSATVDESGLCSVPVRSNSQFS